MSNNKKLITIDEKLLKSSKNRKTQSNDDDNDKTKSKSSSIDTFLSELENEQTSGLLLPVEEEHREQLPKIPQEKANEYFTEKNALHEKYAWTFIDHMFNDNPHFAIQHHLNSYNFLYKQGIKEMFTSLNPLRLYSQYDSDLQDYRYKCDLYFGGKDGSKIYYGKPIIHEQTQHFLFPSEARDKGLTYGTTIHYDVDIVITFLPVRDNHPIDDDEGDDDDDEDDDIEKEEGSTDEFEEEPIVIHRSIPNVYLGKFPIMLFSTNCILYKMTPAIRSHLGETLGGGYFVVDGKNVYLPSIETPATNEIRITIPKKEVTLDKCCIYLSDDDALLFKHGDTIEIPLFVLFRALGIIPDKQIINMCLLNDISKFDIALLEFFRPSIHHASSVKTRAQAFQYIIDHHPKHMKIIEDVQSFLLYDFFSNNELHYYKALMLGQMVWKLFDSCSCSSSSFFVNSSSNGRKQTRILTSGDLVGQMLLDGLRKQKLAMEELLEDIRDESMIDKGLDFIHLIEFNQTRLFQKRVAEESFYTEFHRKCKLFTNPNQLREIVHLDPSSLSILGMTDHNGNLAIGTTITPPVGKHVCDKMEAWLYEHGPLVKLHTAGTLFLAKSTRVFLNGYWIGLVEDPHVLHEKFLLYRRNGLLPLFANIELDYLANSLSIWIDAGRYVRPVFYCDSFLVNADQELVYTVDNPLDKDLIVPRISYQGHQALEKIRDRNLHLHHLVSGFAKKNIDFTTVEQDIYDFKTMYGMEDHESTGNVVNTYFNGNFIIPLQELDEMLTGGGGGSKKKNNDNDNDDPDKEKDLEKEKEKEKERELEKEKEREKESEGNPDVVRFHSSKRIHTFLLKYAGIVDYIDLHESESSLIAFSVADLVYRGLKYYTHLEIHPTLHLDATSSSLITFINHQPHEYTHKASCHYSVSSSITTHHHPIIQSRIYPYLQPPVEGFNLVVAVMSTSYGDGIIINRGTIDRGLKFDDCGVVLISRSGVAGAISHICPDQDMPFTANGLVPDIIINPRCMHVGEIISLLTGKISAIRGAIGDSTPFAPCAVFASELQKPIADLMSNAGFHGSGEDILYDGRTGQQFEANIYTGVSFFSPKRPPQHNLIHLDESAVESIAALGMSSVAATTGDDDQTIYLPICNQTGTIAIYNPEKDIQLSPTLDGPLKYTHDYSRLETTAKEPRNISFVKVSRQFKHLIHELQTMNVQTRIITDETVNAVIPPTGHNLQLLSRRVGNQSDTDNDDWGVKIMESLRAREEGNNVSFQPGQNFLQTVKEEPRLGSESGIGSGPESETLGKEVQSQPFSQFHLNEDVELITEPGKLWYVKSYLEPGQVLIATPEGEERRVTEPEIRRPVEETLGLDETPGTPAPPQNNIVISPVFQMASPTTATDDTNTNASASADASANSNLKKTDANENANENELSVVGGSTDLKVVKL